jgi:ribosomal protein L34
MLGRILPTHVMFKIRTQQSDTKSKRERKCAFRSRDEEQTPSGRQISPKKLAL